MSHSEYLAHANVNDAARNLTKEEAINGPGIDQNTFKIRITVNDEIKRANGWTTKGISLAEFGISMVTHVEVLKKDNAAVYVPGTITGERRTKTAIQELSALVLDLDKGDDLDALVAAIERRGLCAFIHSTYSHLTRETEISLERYRRFTGSNVVNAYDARRYLLQERKYPHAVLEDVTIGTHPNAAAAACLIRHLPLAKYRAVFPLAKPFGRRDHTGKELSQPEFEALWRAKYLAFADSLGVRCDGSCADVNRAFYYPSCRYCEPKMAKKAEGKLLDLDTVMIAETGTGQRGGDAAEAHKTITFNGVSLNGWAAQYADTFLIEDALRASKTRPTELFRNERPEGGVHIVCPFESDHSQPGGNGTFVVNGREGGAGFRVHCCHNSCLSERGDGTKVDRLAMLQKMLGNGWLTLQDLQNPEFGCGPLSARAYHEYGRHARRDGLRVLDRDGHGIDVALFHSGVIAKAGSFDFRQLNELCGTQIEADISPDVLAGFIEAGRVTRAQLETCVTPKPGEKDADPYVRRLQNLARAKLAGERTQRDVDVELEAVRREFEVKVKTAEKDFAGIEKKVREQPASSGLGFLSAKESAVLTRVRDYARDFAILNVGGHGLVLALRQPDISKALMPTRDFELLHRDDWVKVKDKDGRESVVYPAKEFLTTPPRNALFYRGGVVFRPSGTVAADQYNLYRGMLVAPDPSGSCSLLRKLIDEVWAQGDEPVTQWVMEYLMHIIAYPGQKIGTSIAIRGGYGDGKSIVFEKCLSTILGDMLLRVANHRVVLGDYNEAMMGKLVTVLEEATFVGDKGNFDKMKEIVTGEKILINPKFKAPMSVDNYSRLIVISNHDHFMYIKPGDRRYTVLESGPAWKNEPKKFDALVEQWNRGGAARFVYEALNHSFRRLPGRETLIINTNLDTSAAVRQMAQSRSGLEKCIVEFLLRGGLGDAMLSWTLRNPYNIPSWQLRQCVTGWLNEHDASSARHETALHLIIETLDKYAGVTDAERPKGARNLETGKRPQLPTIRRLPPRREAIEHAWRNNLITEAEYVFALPEIERPDETGAYRWQGSEESFDHISYPALWEMDDDDPG